MPGEPKAPTIRDVAKAAGVSTATVSLVINGRADAIGISAACIERVKGVAQALGYQRNYHATTLSGTQRSKTLGLCTLHISDTNRISSFWSTISVGVERAAYTLGYDVLHIGASADRDVHNRSLEHLRARRIDALIILGWFHMSLNQEFRACKQPMVFIAGAPGMDHPYQIDFDESPGLIEAAEHLAKLGHRRALYLIENLDGQLRLESRAMTFRRAAALHGVDVSIVALHLTAAPIQDSEAYQGALSGLQLPPDVTAIVCFNDEMALALYENLRVRGVRIPQDMSVIGFDDLDLHFFHPPLTTISHELHEMGAQASRLAIRLLEPDPPEAHQRVLVSSRLVVRKSTAAPSAR